MMLDIKTLMLLYLIINVISAGAVALIWRQNRGRFAGITFWLVDIVLQAIGSTLIVLRGIVPDLISMTLANTLILAGALIILIGLERFTGQKGRHVHDYLLLAVFVAVSAYFAVVQPSLMARDIAVSVMSMFYTFQCCWLLLRRVAPGMRHVTRLTGIVFAAYAAFSLARIFLTAIFPALSSDYFRSGVIDALAILAYIVLSVCLIISLVLMVNRRLLEDVKAQEEKFTIAFHSSPYAVTLTRLSDGKIFEVNDGFERITGYQYAEVIGKTTSDLRLWVRDEDRLAVVNQLAQGREVQEMECQFRKKSGELLTGLFSANLITINNEKCILSHIADISERQRVEHLARERMKELSAFYSLAELTTREGITLDSLYQEFTDILPKSWQYQEITCARVMINGREFRSGNFADSAWKQSAPVRVYGSVAGGIDVCYLENRPELDEGPFMKEERFLIDALAERIGHLTERKQSENEVKSLNERFALATRAANMGVWDWDVVNNNLVWDQQMYALYGLKREDFAGAYDAWINSIHIDDRDRSDRESKLALLGEAEYDTEFRIIWPDGSIRYIKADGQVFRDEDGKPLRMIGVNYDITDRKKMEEERQRLAKLESVGLLAGGIAHDFNNILTAILGNISLASMEAAPGSDLLHSLEQAEKASMRAKELTVRLLTFSKGGTPVKKLVSLVELLRDTAILALSGSNVRCRFSIPDDLWHAEIDAGQVNQAIRNLVINAQQSMPAGGSIEVRAENIILGHTQNLGRALPLKEGAYIRIAVIDHGTGIPAENLGKIFDAFFTTRPKGNGMGLAVSFSIAHQHGGYISMESEIGTGSTFYLYLPASTHTIATGQNKKEADKPAGKVRILVMDDEKGVREIAGRMLRHIGYSEVEFAADGAEAVKLYKAAMGTGLPFALAILDLTIAGGMGGEWTIQKLLKIDPAVKAIVSSGYIDDPVIARYRDYGFSGMVAKPYTIEELRKALQEVIG